ncbi:GFA family protein [Rhodobacterales bacterium HKCCE2091]|nr:GFA family protein [Rhodobacterales bacterium HKCCE2091]
MHDGSCLCGAIRYRVTAELGPVTACHCTQCRKITGHYAAAVPAPWDSVAVTGEVKWYRSSEAARRGFCPDCGSYLFWEEYDGLVYLMAGALDGETGLRMDGHIFYADRGDYYRAGEALPCYAQGRSGPEIEP